MNAIVTSASFNMIEEPTKAQKWSASIEHAARVLADGRAMGTVRVVLEKRGMTPEDIDGVMDEISGRAGELMRERRKMVRRVGVCWLLVGSAALIGFAWALILHGRCSVALLLGLVPLGYRIHLLRLPATRESDLEPPQFFGRK